MIFYKMSRKKIIRPLKIIGHELIEIIEKIPTIVWDSFIHAEREN